MEDKTRTLIVILWVSDRRGPCGVGNLELSSTPYRRTVDISSMNAADETNLCCRLPAARLAERQQEHAH